MHTRRAPSTIHAAQGAHMMRYSTVYNIESWWCSALSSSSIRFDCLFPSTPRYTVVNLFYWKRFIRNEFRWLISSFTFFMPSVDVRESERVSEQDENIQQQYDDDVFMIDWFAPSIYANAPKHHCSFLMLMYVCVYPVPSPRGILCILILYTFCQWKTEEKKVEKCATENSSFVKCKSFIFPYMEIPVYSVKIYSMRTKCASERMNEYVCVCFCYLSLSRMGTTNVRSGVEYVCHHQSDTEPPPEIFFASLLRTFGIKLYSLLCGLFLCVSARVSRTLACWNNTLNVCKTTARAIPVCIERRTYTYRMRCGTGKGHERTNEMENYK